MRSPNKSLLLIITALVLTSACLSSELPEKRVEAKTTEALSQQNTTVVAAIVKARKANLRDGPSPVSTVVGTVNKGDLLPLPNEPCPPNKLPALFRPILTTLDFPQETMHRWSIAARAVVTFGEASREGRLIDMAVLSQYGKDGHRHERVVCVGPRSSG